MGLGQQHECPWDRQQSPVSAQLDRDIMSDLVQTYLAQVTEMCKLPSEAPLIGNLGALGPIKEGEFKDQIF